MRRGVFLLMLGALLLLLAGCTKTAEKAVLQVQTTGGAVEIDTGFTPVPTLAGFYKIAGKPVLLEEKPFYIFVGAQFCPFCAAQRWAVVEALSRFGSFSGLKLDRSADGEGFSTIPTYDFMGVSYLSEYLTFIHKETADREGNSLDELGDLERGYVNKYNLRGAIPFTVVSGQYARVGPGHNPGVLQGKGFEEVKAELSREESEIRKAVLKDADVLTALICSTTGSQPASACERRGVQEILAQLPKEGR